MDNPELIDKYDGKLRQIMLDMRHDGIPHKTIYYIFKNLTNELEIMAKSELALSPSEKPEKGHEIDIRASLH